MTEHTLLVLSGGNALGAYEAGAYETLHAQGLHPERIVAVSTGAINAALIAGNPPEKRVERLRGFWSSAMRETPGWPMMSTHWPLAWDSNRARALQSTALGSPAIYHPRFPGMLSMFPGMPMDTSVYDLAPLRKTLEQSVDFGRLNSGEIRLTVVAVDMCSGEEIRFDTTEAPLEMDHLLASCGFVPFFSPVSVGDRLVVDGGLASNLPLEAALAEPFAKDQLCIAIDLFRRRSQGLRTVGQAMDRQLELLLSTQTCRALAGLKQAHALRRHLRLLGERLPESERADPALAQALAEGAKIEAATTLLLLNHACVTHDAEMRAFDFSRPALTERWDCGRSDMAHALEALGSQRAGPGEFMVQAFSGCEPLDMSGVGPA
ncbi:NTE family protein [Pseudomonas duriflava]|uniref:NTE family protein n=1 Tax=Pseudomonas duriflava TaxID=459528 RepID=A0A562QKY5_9PSED|nr:patatin-like phospholipase family protein [Pseudomonas duriflava]TWI57343.1 NTE family protein [Pseudomonas duriflava]